VVSDQGTNNQSTFKHMGITYTEPFYKYNNEKMNCRIQTLSGTVAVRGGFFSGSSRPDCHDEESHTPQGNLVSWGLYVMYFPLLPKKKELM
jgi:hypothetical protein